MNKAAALGGVVLGLLWGLSAVQGVVKERQGRQAEAARGVADSLAGEQTLLGPILLRRCTERWLVEEGDGAARKVRPEQRDFTLASAPATLAINASADMAPRHRGLFKVNAYTAKATVQARWTDLSALVPRPRHEGASLTCEDPVLSVAVGDARGLRNVRLALRGRPLAVASGPAHVAHRQGFHARLPADMLSAAGPTDASLVIELAGTQSLAFAPVGGETTVSLSSPWPHPSFNGRFLPTERQIGEQGFAATWRLSALATTAQQAYVQGGALCPLAPAGLGTAASTEPYDTTADAVPSRPDGCVETFSVDFIDPVNPYVLSDRATKYGLLFIGLTFLGVILVELMNRLRVHPIQYLLVGSALTMFFLLLVSLSEHLGFAAAYGAAASACTGLLMFYAAHILGGWRRGLVFGGAVAALYGTLYLLLQLEQTSLVLGSILLFVVLAAVMVVTRRLDWYGLMTQMRSTPAPAAPGVPSAQAQV